MSEIRSYSMGGVHVETARASGSTALRLACDLSRQQGIARVLTPEGRMTWYRKGKKVYETKP